jgi:hypothetical protein
MGPWIVIPVSWGQPPAAAPGGAPSATAGHWRLPRSASAMRELGLDTIVAVIRGDLADDEAAFHTAVIENEQRKTYSDIDRALVILRHQQAGWTSLDIGRAHKPTHRRLGSIFNENATDKARGVFRLDAVKVVVADLDDQDRQQLRAELTELLEALG